MIEFVVSALTGIIIWMHIKITRDRAHSDQLHELNARRIADLEQTLRTIRWHR